MICLIVNAESTHKGINQSSKCVTQAQQQRPESPTVALTWHASKYNSTSSLSFFLLFFFFSFFFVLFFFFFFFFSLLFLFYFVYFIFIFIYLFFCFYFIYFLFILFFVCLGFCCCCFASFLANALSEWNVTKTNSVYI